MLKLVVFLTSLSLLFSLEQQNVPHFNPDATRIFYYTTTKEPSGALKPSFLITLKTYFNIHTLIESGTNQGNTTANGAAIFEKVHTIELFPPFYEKAAVRFKNYSNVTLHLVDSGQILGRILSLSDQKILFYLDGHYDGGDYSGKGVKNTPIIEELAAIQKSGITDSLILIDDICDFQGSIYPRRIFKTCFEGYPTLKFLIDHLLKINPSYKICFFGNALLAFPPTADITLSPVASSCAINRLSTVTDLFSNELLLESEKIIAAAKGFEKQELIHYFQHYANFEWHFGWRSFASFWYGLILQEEGKQTEAAQMFYTTALNSLPGWRVNQYVPK